MTRKLAEPTTLPIHEWLAILACGVFLFILIALSQMSFHPNEKQLGQPHYLYDQTIEVMITGAVEAPGRYTFQKGAVMKDLFSKASLTSKANLKRLKPQAKLRNGQMVHIPETTSPKRQKQS